MPRARQIGLTEGLKDKVMHIDRLPPEIRKNVVYDVRMIIEKELEDLEWFYTEGAESFRRSRDHEYKASFEAVMPSDPKRIRDTITKLEGWISAVERVRDAVAMMGLRFLKTGRL